MSLSLSAVLRYGIAAPEMEHRTYSDGRQFMVLLLG